MKYVKLVSALMISALLVTSCTSETKEATEPTPESVSKTTETTEDTLLAVDEEVSEADLRDPIKQYKRYNTLFSQSISKKEPSIDESKFRELATDEVTDRFLEIFDGMKDEDIYFLDPPGYEDIETSNPISSDIFTKDEDGSRIFMEGATITFKICSVDDTINVDRKTDVTLTSPSENLDTFESLVSMAFLDGKWKVSGQETLNKTKGVVECEFQK